MHFSMYPLATLLAVVISAAAMPAHVGSGQSTPLLAVALQGDYISHVRFRQDPAISYTLVAIWRNAHDTGSGRKKLGAGEPEAIFNLKHEGIPDGAFLNFAAVSPGETSDIYWFIVDYSAGKGADYEMIQTTYWNTTVYNAIILNTCKTYLNSHLDTLGLQESAVNVKPKCVTSARKPAPGSYSAGSMPS
ncbi:hypothetical protein C8R46DRAFT_1278407 [Mycena filopes]|nr:hypothetical protein C8R46DRAFT_1278407 [Mycena filopes]